MKLPHFNIPKWLKIKEIIILNAINERDPEDKQQNKDKYDEITKVINKQSKDMSV